MKKRPPHPVWKSKLAQLAWLINTAIDCGDYELSMEQVRAAAKSKRITHLIQEHLPSHPLLDFSLWNSEDRTAVNEWFYNINGNHDIYIEKNGLCLLLAWTIEMMQHAGDPDDFK